MSTQSDLSSVVEAQLRIGVQRFASGIHLFVPGAMDRGGFQVVPESPCERYVCCWRPSSESMPEYRSRAVCEQRRPTDYQSRGRGFMRSQRSFGSVPEEGVLELELTAEEVRALAQPREVRPSVAVRVVPSAPPREVASSPPVAGSSFGDEVSLPRTPPRLANIGLTLGAAVVVVVGVASFYSSGSGDSVTAPDPATVLALETVDDARPAPVVVHEPPVRFANPFDPTEVFEFPAGTTKAAAREKVADLLIRRAQERRPSIRRVATIHSVSAAK
jgi:hypothetical protein